MAGNLPLSLVTIDDVVWDQLVQIDAPLGSPVSSTVAGVAPVQTWEYTEQVLPDIGDVDNKLLAAAGLSNTILISTTTKEVLETITVSIGMNGNWYVGNEDTGVAAVGTSPGAIARPTGMYRASLITQAGNLLTIAAGAQFVTSSGGTYYQFATTADVVITLDMDTTLLTIDRDGIIREYPAGANLWLIPESEAVVAIAVDSLAVKKTFVMPTVHNAWAVAGASRTFAELAQTAALTAESFATTAVVQAAAATASASLAEEWASKPENSAITGNPSKYSARHWAMKAQQWAGVVSSALIWKGGWSAAMNTAPPTPAIGTGAHFYRITAAGTISGTAYAVGDYIHWDTITLVWFKVDGTDSVTSVNGKLGAVTLGAADVGALALSGGLLNGTLSIAAGSGAMGLSMFHNYPAGPNVQGVQGFNLAGDTRQWSVGVYADNGIPTYAYLGIGVTPWNTGLQVRSGSDIRAGGANRIYHEGYKPTADDVGALPTSGLPIDGYLSFNRGEAGFGWGVRENSVNGNLEFKGRIGTGAYTTYMYMLPTGEMLLTASGHRAYHRGNVVGTVSQSAGVPSGAIIEKGSGANGSYVKYADGTLMMWHSLTVSFASDSLLQGTWTFPIAIVGGVVLANGPITSDGRQRVNRASATGGNTAAGTSSIVRLWAAPTDVFIAGDVAVLPVMFMGRWY